MSDRYFGERDISSEYRIADWQHWDFYNTDSSGSDIAGAGPVKVSIAGQGAVERARALLAGVPDGVEKAMKSAIRSAERTLRRESTTEIRKRYDITAQNIRSERNVSVSYSYGNGVQATVRYAGRRIPLIRFGGAYPQIPTPDTSQRVPVPVPVSLRGGVKGKEMRLVHPGIPARGHVLKSTAPTQFQSAFTARVKSQTGRSHIGIFERTGGATGTMLISGKMFYFTDEMQELFGPSVAQMIGHQEVAEKLTDKAYQSFESEMEQAVYRILTGW